MISNISFKIALPIILVGLFIIVIFIALESEKLDAGFYIVLLSLVVYIFLFGFATGQNFALPVKRILKKATELSEGDLTSRVYLETKDEFSELAKIFNRIAENLEESRSMTEKTEKSVDMKVKAKTQDLEETINALEQKVKNRSIELERIISESENFKEEVSNKAKEVSELKEEINNLRLKISKYAGTTGSRNNNKEPKFKGH
ncbi:MAG: methyl-accepting chemotaxis protein [Parcubacteria group bacterium Licking1014_1]|nr:MAG: methyl-accepting chemotaxis protein [Parcubacteria group bacterium Licking1014_1]